MGIEIEHKYLVVDNSYREKAFAKEYISQGYLCRDKDRTIRVRIKDDKGFLTIKGHTTGDMRKEFEYPIPVADARELMNLCPPPVIEKVRFKVMHGGFVWEIDDFSSPATMPSIAEIELPSSSTSYPIPSFVGQNVTGDPRFYNSNIQDVNR